MCKVQSHINSAASGGAEVGAVTDSGVIVQSADLTPTALSLSLDRGEERVFV